MKTLQGLLFAGAALTGLCSWWFWQAGHPHPILDGAFIGIGYCVLIIVGMAIYAPFHYWRRRREP